MKLQTRWQRLPRDVAGGSLGALTAVPVVPGCGAVLYETLGAAFIGAVIPAPGAPPRS